MRIASVSTLQVAGVPDGTRDFTRGASGAPAPLVIVTGPPGSGKTALLEAIATTKEAIAPYGGTPGREMVAPGATAAKVSIDWHLDDEELAVAGGAPRRPSEALFGDVQRAPETAWDDGLRLVLGRWAPHLPKVEYVHAPRAMRRPAGSVASSAGPSPRLRLTRDDAKYDGLHDEIVGWTVDGDDLAGQFERAFAALCPTRSFAGLVRRGGARLLGFERPGSDHWVAVHELSAAEHQAALFAATFAVVGLWRSVVLVDMPELFLPTDWIGPFVRALAAMGDNQLVLATASREVLAAADGAVIVDLGKA